jgi:large subunit ribosomal protein L22
VAGAKTNERPGTRAVLRHCRLSAFKARQVLDLIRGRDADEAAEILRLSEREAARVVAKLLRSAVANAENNDGLDPEELYVSACFADEATTLKRWRPRARGRATRVRKRTCHLTLIVSRMPEERLARRRARQAAGAASRRARRVAGARRREAAARAAEEPTVPSAQDEAGAHVTEPEGAAAEETAAEEAPAEEAPAEEAAAPAPAQGEGARAQEPASEGVGPGPRSEEED